MKRVRVLQILAAAGTGACLGVGWLRAGWVLPAGIAVLAAVLWVSVRKQVQLPADPAFFVIFSALSAGGVFGGVQIGWMAAGMYLNLAAWDLGEFLHQLERFEPVSGLEGLIRNHLLMLTAVGLGSLAAVLLVPRLDLQIRFFWVVVLAAGSILALNRLVGQLGEK